MSRATAAAALAALLALAATASSLPPGEQIGAVEVNGVTISAERIRTAIAIERSSRGVFHGNVATTRGPGRLEAVVLDRLIGRELLVQEARAAGLEVSAAEAEDAWKAERGRWSSEEMFLKSLEVRGGISPEYLRERLTEDVLINKLVRMRVDDAIELTEADLRDYYESHWNEYLAGEPPLRYLFISRTDIEGRRSATERLDEYRSRFVKDGEPFAEVAADLSDHSSAARGGLLEEQPADPPPFFYERGFGLKPSRFTSPHLQDESGHHVYFREARTNAPRVPFEEVREEIGAKLFKERSEAGLVALVAELREKAEVRISPPVQ